MTIQSYNNNLNCLIDSIFTKINRLFVVSFARIAGENNTPKDRRDLTLLFVTLLSTKHHNKRF